MVFRIVFIIKSQLVDPINSSLINIIKLNNHTPKLILTLDRSIDNINIIAVEIVKITKIRKIFLLKILFFEGYSIIIVGELIIDCFERR